MKTCSKCKVEKSRAEFCKRSAVKDGLMSQCKMCNKEYRDKNKINIAKRVKQWQQDNKEQISNDSKIYKAENKESISKKDKIYRENNKDKEVLRHKIYRDNNKESIAASNKVYKAKNKHKAALYKRKRRALKAMVEENFTTEQAKATLILFNNQCFNCDSTKKLCIDHHKPLSKGNPLTPQNAVILCNSCNCSKGPKPPEEFYTEEQLIKLEELLNANLTQTITK